MSAEGGPAAPLPPDPFAVAAPIETDGGAPLRAADGTVSVLANPLSPPQPRLPPPVADAAPPFQAQTQPLQAPLQAPPSPPPIGARLVARSLEMPVPGVPTTPAVQAAPPRPLTLLEALERSGDRSRRLWITQSYWKLAAAAARSRFAADAEDRLALVAPGSHPEDLMLLDLDTAAARAESAAAGVELIAAQQELVDLVRLPVGDAPPWPVDMPLTAAYQTHFDTIFATRPATGRVRAIHRQLPLEHGALTARGEAVEAARNRFATLEALHAQGSHPIGAVLAAHDALLEQEEAFVATFRTYNLDIAEYVMAVADLTVPDDRFATMLIGQPIPWRQPTAGSPAVPGTVIPVGGNLPLPPAPGVPLTTPAMVVPAGGQLPGNGFLPAAPPRFGG